MTSVLIVDDELAGRKLIEQYLDPYSDFEILGFAKNGLEAVKLINNLKPDLVFLDIQMPGLTGFEVIAQLDEIPQIVFSTAYDEYALKAFEVHAIDYLLKPYTAERFSKAINGLNANSKQKALGALAEELKEEKQKTLEQLLVSKNKKLYAIKSAHIIWIEAYGDYSKIHSASASYISNHGISTLEKKLESQSFMRVHRSSLVNLNHIVTAEKYGKEYLLELTNNDKIMVSRSNAKKIKDLIL